MAWSQIRDGYLYGDEAKKAPDATDKAFQACYTAGKLPVPLTLYGLHRYGGYHGFFRPDLEEIINLFAPHVAVKDLARMRLYVTTEPHPNDHGSACYDREADRHRGETLVYVVAEAAAEGPPGGPKLSA